MAEIDKNYIWNERDEKETYRLNFQHRLALAVSNETLVHPSVPISQLKRVADIATGTGVWLQDFEHRYPSSGGRQYTGFDISSKLFPKSSSNMVFLVHDMLQPFPPQYHKSFDLIHVRFMLLALRKDQYQQAVRNLLQILKPGGYFQWDEGNIGLATHIPNDPALQPYMDVLHEFMQDVGFDSIPKDRIEEAFKAEGLERVQIEFNESFQRPELKEQLRTWGLNTMSATIPMSYLRTGRAKNEVEAKRIGEEGMAEFRRSYGEGTVPIWPISIVIGRKPV